MRLLFSTRSGLSGLGNLHLRLSQCQALLLICKSHKPGCLRPSVMTNEYTGSSIAMSDSDSESFSEIRLRNSGLRQPHKPAGPWDSTVSGNTMTPIWTALPQELLEVIAHYMCTDDEGKLKSHPLPAHVCKSLAAFSLVSRYMCNMCRRRLHLFHNIVLRRSEDVTSLISCLQAPPVAGVAAIALCIKTVDIVVSPIVSPILGLPSIRTLALLLPKVTYGVQMRNDSAPAIQLSHLIYTVAPTPLPSNSFPLCRVSITNVHLHTLCELVRFVRATPSLSILLCHEVIWDTLGSMFTHRLPRWPPSRAYLKASKCTNDALLASNVFWEMREPSQHAISSRSADVATSTLLHPWTSSAVRMSSDDKPPYLKMDRGMYTLFPHYIMQHALIT